MDKLLGQIPTPLLEDIISQRSIPILGAGFSANADLSGGLVMPVWDEVGKHFASLVSPDYPYSSPIDALSAFEQEFSRSTLVERLRSTLHLEDSKPGPAHLAFAQLQFDIVVTTNFDFLLEKAYGANGREYVPIVDEAQLAINVGKTSTRLLKLHGDLHHPDRLVVTEQDYDTFIAKFPLLSTYVSNLLIQRTPILMGYSLDDPDLRQLWQVVASRLGKLKRPAYAIIVNPEPTVVSRFHRRGVNVIALRGARKERGKILSALFAELKEYWDQELPKRSQVSSDDMLSELSLPTGATTRLCFFSVPAKLQSYYRTYYFPSVQRSGFTGVTATDMIAPGESLVASISTLIDKSSLVVVDVGSEWPRTEARYASERQKRLLFVVEEGAPIPPFSERYYFVRRPIFPDPPTDDNLADFERMLKNFSSQLMPELQNEALKLLEIGALRAAVISAYSLLEAYLRDRLSSSLPDAPRLGPGDLIETAMRFQVIPGLDRERLHYWRSVRSRLLHSNDQISREEATAVVHEILGLLERFKGQRSS